MAYPATKLPFSYVPECVNNFSKDGETLPFYFVQMIKFGDLTSDVKARVHVQMKNDQFCYVSQNYRLVSLFILF